jgi:hypothetical protein
MRPSTTLKQQQQQQQQQQQENYSFTTDHFKPLHRMICSAVWYGLRQSFTAQFKLTILRLYSSQGERSLFLQNPKKPEKYARVAATMIFQYTQIPIQCFTHSKKLVI